MASKAALGLMVAGWWLVAGGYPLSAGDRLPHIDYDQPVQAASASAPHRWPLLCDSGPNTVQFIWTVAPGETLNMDVADSMLSDVAEQVNAMFWVDSDSAAAARLPAWKMTADCRLDIKIDVAPGAVAASPGGTIPPIGATKYMRVADDKDYCGYAFVFDDTRPGPENVHNGDGYAAVARHCLNARVVAHELLHMIGAIQLDAPHSDGGYHGNEFDVMGYPSRSLRCKNPKLIDCGHDDYFSLQPSGYLAEHWNSADSMFLVRVRRWTLWLPGMMGEWLSTPLP